LELMIVLALASLLASVAVPTLSTFISYGHRATELNRLLRDLRYARSEAVARGLTVTLCTSPNGVHCNTSVPWDKGWIIFVDRNADLTRTTDESILRAEPAFTSGDRLSGNTLVAHHIGYQREGFLQGLHNGTITFTSEPARAALRRCLIVSRTGRIRVADSTDKLCDGK
jgi:type IV fimbrial biogenesis protein FimT